MLQASASDHVRGRLQGIFVVVVAGGPRVADTAHGAAAALVGTAAAAAGGGILVVVGVLAVAIAVPAFVRTGWGRRPEHDLMLTSLVEPASASERCRDLRTPVTGSRHGLARGSPARPANALGCQDAP